MRRHTRNFARFVLLAFAACGDEGPRADAENPEDAATSTPIALTLNSALVSVEVVDGSTVVHGEPGALSPGGVHVEIETADGDVFGTDASDNGSFDIDCGVTISGQVTLRASWRDNELATSLSVDVPETRSCEARELLVESAIRGAELVQPHACETDDDCALVELNTTCRASCLRGAIAVDGMEAFEARRADIDAQLCTIATDESCATPELVCDSTVANLTARCKDLVKTCEVHTPGIHARIVPLVISDMSDYSFWVPLPNAGYRKLVTGDLTYEDIPFDREGQLHLLYGRSSFDHPDPGTGPFDSPTRVTLSSEIAEDEYATIAFVYGQPIAFLNESRLDRDSAGGDVNYVHIINGLTSRRDSLPMFGIAGRLCVENAPIDVTQTFAMTGELAAPTFNFFRSDGQGGCGEPLSSDDVSPFTLMDNYVLSTFQYYGGRAHALIALTEQSYEPIDAPISRIQVKHLPLYPH